MATFNVTKIRKEAPAGNPTHEHIVGVFTSDGTYRTVQEVADSIEAGDEWQTAPADAPPAAIGVELFCPNAWCMMKPYLSSCPGPFLASDLEKLPRG
ncbi:hypothetical protein [Anaeromyxobacter paludicola]|uniref:DUF3892 domain-containing protein n=1 Tax=Anaeromyxobacter paludicola TaxID=2918171 RepID=A0ABM7XDY3_9BACT|nr:hypothetical protein [Anaeromyxobacter paludicola]BDG10067.1 hypothetical protein AMPC_31800 [Anaeromyxobacter paludicola]